MAESPEDIRFRVTALGRDLHEAEAEGDQHVGFTVRGKRFAWLLDDHHGDGRLALACKAPSGQNEELAEAHPERFFIPSYVGPRGWLGLYLDTATVDWDEVERVLVEAYLMSAPKRLAAELREP